MPRRRSPPRDPRTCIRCRKAVFDPNRRDVRAWPMIDDHDASDHCTACWFALAKTLGRPFGKPDAPRGLPCPTIPSRTSSAAWKA